MNQKTLVLNDSFFNTKNKEVILNDYEIIQRIQNDS